MCPTLRDATLPRQPDMSGLLGFALDICAWLAALCVRRPTILKWCLNGRCAMDSKHTPSVCNTPPACGGSKMHPRLCDGLKMHPRLYAMDSRCTPPVLRLYACNTPLACGGTHSIHARLWLRSIREARSLRLRHDTSRRSQATSCSPTDNIEAAKSWGTAPRVPTTKTPRLEGVQSLGPPWCIFHVCSSGQAHGWFQGRRCCLEGLDSRPASRMEGQSKRRPCSLEKRPPGANAA